MEHEKVTGPFDLKQLHATNASCKLVFLIQPLHIIFHLVIIKAHLDKKRAIPEPTYLSEQGDEFYLIFYL